jgi:hypothetical protein
MTVDALWAAVGLTAEPIDASEPIFAISRSREPLLIDIGDEGDLPELLLLPY